MFVVISFFSFKKRKDISASFLQFQWKTEKKIGHNCSNVGKLHFHINLSLRALPVL